MRGMASLNVSVSVEKQVGGVNRAQLARDLGLSRVHVSRILNGKRVPSFTVAVEMARRMRLKLEDLQGYLERAAVN